MSKFITLLLVIFCSVGVQAAPNMSIYEAINKAGYQRMLTQRIAKCYVSVVAEIEPEKHKRHLQGSAKSFENNLRELIDYQASEEIGEQFRYVEVLWRKYKFVYDDYYTKANAETILEYNNKILKACHKAVVMLEEYAIENNEYGDQELRAGDKKLAHVINLSGKQRMLTQRLALYAIAATHKIGNIADNKEHYSQAVVDFSTAYSSLLSYPKNTRQIDEEYTSVSSKWADLERDMGTVLAASDWNEELQSILIRALQNADDILFTFDEIVFLYERKKEK